MDVSARLKEKEQRQAGKETMKSGETGKNISLSPGKTALAKGGTRLHKTKTRSSGVRSSQSSKRDRRGTGLTFLRELPRVLGAQESRMGAEGKSTTRRIRSGAATKGNGHQKLLLRKKSNTLD